MFCTSPCCSWPSSRCSPHRGLVGWWWLCLVLFSLGPPLPLYCQHLVFSCKGHENTRALSNGWPLSGSLQPSRGLVSSSPAPRCIRPQIGERHERRCGPYQYHLHETTLQDGKNVFCIYLIAHRTCRSQQGRRSSEFGHTIGAHHTNVVVQAFHHTIDTEIQAKRNNSISELSALRTTKAKAKEILD